MVKIWSLNLFCLYRFCSTMFSMKLWKHFTCLFPLTNIKPETLALFGLGPEDEDLEYDIGDSFSTLSSLSSSSSSMIDVGLFSGVICVIKWKTPTVLWNNKTTDIHVYYVVNSPWKRIDSTWIRLFLGSHLPTYMRITTVQNHSNEEQLFLWVRLKYLSQPKNV